MPLADSYDGFLFDLDGVCWLGHEFLPGAAETINELLAGGKPVAFVTNSPRIPRSETAQYLRDGGVDVPDELVITAASTLIARALEELGDERKVVAVGTDSFKKQLVEAGLEIVRTDDWQTARAVLVSGHFGFNYEELNWVARAVRDGAPLLATGRDPTMPMPDGLWPGTGSIIAAIETASGGTAIATGKPEPAIFEAGLDAIGRPDRVAMVGDRIDTDISGAQNLGIAGILVTTGATSQEELEASPIEPDHLIESLTQLLD